MFFLPAPVTFLVDRVGDLDLGRGAGGRGAAGAGPGAGTFVPQFEQNLSPGVSLFPSPTTSHHKRTNNSAMGVRSRVCACVRQGVCVSCVCEGVSVFGYIYM